MIKYWMSLCSDAHRACCTLKKPADATVREFRAIDGTKSLPAVQNLSWSEQYVALNYVWGAATQKWPQTIHDAIILTRRLGYKYLWVDRLCIDQSKRDEKRYLISKMDAIYEYADFVIVNAAGDAQIGLPGMGATKRRLQHRVELDILRDRSPCEPIGDDAYLKLVNVPQAEYENETADNAMWLDDYRHGLRSMMKISLDGPTQDDDRMQRYGIPRDQLEFHEDSANSFNVPFDEYMGKQQQLADTLGLKLHELVPHFLREAARKRGIPDDQPAPTMAKPDPDAVTDPDKPMVPLPPGRIAGKTVLVSTMQDPRVTIRASQWATRGWTYQESALARRCLVFTPEQVYWECRGIAVSESTLLPLPRLHVHSSASSSWRFADYMLSGVFRGEEHRAPELEYGFQHREYAKESDVRAQVTILDRHIRSFTSRKLTEAADSWDAFLGIAARYVGNEQGLSLLLDIPYWPGSFADGRAALQHSLALSLSHWSHVGQPVEFESKLFIADCPRRAELPSWSWIGWEGTVDFNDGHDHHSHNSRADFFFAMTSSEWAKAVDRIWSARMMLHSEDGQDWTWLEGNVSLQDFADTSKKRLLTIKQPLVLKHMFLMPSSNDGEWRRLMGKLVEIHLSVPLAEQQLLEDYQSGSLVAVLIFAGKVPFIWEGRARFMVLRKTGADGKRWERIGTLVLTIEESQMDEYTSSQDMVDDLPLRKSETDLTVV